MTSVSTSVMHKVQFARGIGQREMLRANTLPSITRAKIGCLARLHIHEENARFVLLGLLILVYLSFGAYLFNYLERDNEVEERKQYLERSQFLRSLLCNDSFCRRVLEELLALHGNASLSGQLSPRERFDLAGAFFFSGTVISTIGFGTSTPRTLTGRLATVAYGVVGCTFCVLFFNLFLERLITAFAMLLRYFHERKIARRMSTAAGPGHRPVTLLINNADYAESASSLDGHTDHWRPSVYKVFLMLFTACLILISSVAAVYSHAEDWTFFDAFYFSFISFATIGFGDFVSNHQNDVASPDSYRLINFLLLTLGACCFYCLFNVSSIVVRQMLNWIIKKIDVKVRGSMCCCARKRRRYMGLGLRPPPGYDAASERSSVDFNDGLLSLKEFLMNNQSSVFLLQKQLIKSARRMEEDDEREAFGATTVGPLAILNHTFGEN